MGVALSRACENKSCLWSRSLHSASPPSLHTPTMHSPPSSTACRSRSCGTAGRSAVPGLCAVPVRLRYSNHSPRRISPIRRTASSCGTRIPRPLGRQHARRRRGQQQRQGAFRAYRRVRKRERKDRRTIVFDNDGQRFNTSQPSRTRLCTRNPGAQRFQCGASARRTRLMNGTSTSRPRIAPASHCSTRIASGSASRTMARSARSP